MKEVRKMKRIVDFLNKHWVKMFVVVVAAFIVLGVVLPVAQGKDTVFADQTTYPPPIEVSGTVVRFVAPRIWVKTDDGQDYVFIATNQGGYAPDHWQFTITKEGDRVRVKSEEKDLKNHRSLPLISDFHNLNLPEKAAP